MDFTIGIVSRNLATTSNFVEFRECRDFTFFEAKRVVRDLAHFQWLKRFHVSYVELVKHELKCGLWVDTWHDAIG